jgi:P-type Ca2+ transporter type 2C
LCISSNQLDELTLKELSSVLKDAIRAKQNLIFSSITEHQKRKVVKVLQSLHQVVVMSGKDATDELAMIQADIPVAMGLSGTDGAKDKAHIILADDNFNSIVNSIEEGRGIYENMKVM